MRFFAEAAWYPTALLPSQGVRWEAVDDSLAHATLNDGLLTLKLLFRVTGAARLCRPPLSSRTRPRSEDSRIFIQRLGICHGDVCVVVVVDVLDGVRGHQAPVVTPHNDTGRNSKPASARPRPACASRSNTATDFDSYASPRAAAHDVEVVFRYLGINKMLVVAFDNETAADAGMQALRTLHASGDITLYATGVLAKDGLGVVNVDKSTDAGLVGTATGLVSQAWSLAKEAIAV